MHPHASESLARRFSSRRKVCPMHPVTYTRVSRDNKKYFCPNVFRPIVTLRLEVSRGLPLFSNMWQGTRAGCYLKAAAVVLFFSR